MRPRARHPEKEIEKALRDAEVDGAVIEVRGKKGHAWGRMNCGRGGQHECRLRIWSTPGNPYAHARDIRALMRKCPHVGPEPELARTDAPVKEVSNER